MSDNPLKLKDLTFERMKQEARNNTFVLQLFKPNRLSILIHGTNAKKNCICRHYRKV